MTLFSRWYIALPSVLAIFALGFCTHLLWTGSTLSSSTTSAEKALRTVGKYTYIAPLLLCASTAVEAQGPYKELQTKLNTLIQEKKRVGAVTDVSVYFRGGGNWIGINDSESYSPASLLKVPIMIAYFKAAESNPSILEKQLTYTGEEDLNTQEVFKSDQKLIPGGSYKVIDLVRAMIGNSDNNAAALLSTSIDPKMLDEVYTDLGLKPIEEAAPEARTLNVKTYSYFFRVLYNATYLTPEYSEQALSILAHVNFPQGLHGGLPSTVTVAQKFGERSVFDLNTKALIERNLHDCGLVYAKDTPYLLCIMTRGTDFKGLSSTIQDISKTVYESVKSIQ